MQSWISYAVLVSLGLILIIMLNLIVFNFNRLKKIFNNVDKKTWFLIILIVLLGLGLRLFLVEHTHNLYYDEDAYLDIAKNIFEEKQICLCLDSEDGNCNFCGFSLKSIGFTFLLGIFMKIFGYSHEVAFNFVAIVGSLSIFLVFLLSYLIFKKEKLALLISLIFCLYPLHLRWSGSVSAEIISLFFILLSFILLLAYFEDKSNWILLLSLLSLMLAITSKEESVLFGVIYLFILILKEKKDLFKKKWILLIILLILPYIIGSFIFHETNAEYGAGRYTMGKDGSLFSLDLFEKNFIKNISFFFDRSYNPLFILVFSGIGLLLFFKNKFKLSLILLLSSLIVPLLFTFYLDIPLIQSQVRHMIYSVIPISIFAGYGIYSVSKYIKRKKIFYFLVILIVLFSSVFYYEYLTNDNAPVIEPMEDHNFLLENVDSFDNCKIITSEAYILDFMDKDSGSIYTLEFFNNLTKKEDSIERLNDCEKAENETACTLNNFNIIINYAIGEGLGDKETNCDLLKEFNNDALMLFCLDVVNLERELLLNQDINCMEDHPYLNDFCYIKLKIHYYAKENRCNELGDVYQIPRCQESVKIFNIINDGSYLDCYNSFDIERSKNLCLFWFKTLKDMNLGYRKPNYVDVNECLIYYEGEMCYNELKEECKLMHEVYDLEPLMIKEFEDRTYTFYRMNGYYT